MRASRLAILAALAAGLALAQQTPQGEPLQVKVGERKSLCPCPVSGFMCDDPSLVNLVQDAGGQSLEGVKPGSTVCSLYGPNRIKRVYAVTVVAAPPAKRKM
jgi:hypothetical protein